jgi:hypothetical protein
VIGSRSNVTLANATRPPRSLFFGLTEPQLRFQFNKKFDL